MPTYEYECADCGKRFEHFQSITAKPLKRCPACGGPLKRLFGTGVGVIVKGSPGQGSPPCGRERPCCGAESVCEARPCDTSR